MSVAQRRSSTSPQRPIYGRQREFFRRAYMSGDHGWPVHGTTPQVQTLVSRLGSGVGRRALDVGCGEGRHSIFLTTLGYEVVALDLEPLAIHKAADACGPNEVSLHFVVGNALELMFKRQSFDLVLDYGCLHHLVSRDHHQYQLEVARVLKPTGHLVLSVFSTEFKHHPAERRTRNWMVHRDHYDRFFTKSEIADTFRPSFEVDTIIEEQRGLSGYHHALLRARSVFD